jgi:hypothetical protein
MARLVPALAAVLAIILAGCGTATHSAVSATPSRSASSPVPSANVQVCQDYAKQRAWIEDHRATLTLADYANIVLWADTDASESTGQLHEDFASMAAGLNRIVDGGNPTAHQGSAHVRVSDDCSAVGVSMQAVRPATGEPQARRHLLRPAL